MQHCYFSLRLELERKSGHLTKAQGLSDLRQATSQYFLDALPTRVEGQ
jgi:hypothetical protein